MNGIVTIGASEFISPTRMKPMTAEATTNMAFKGTLFGPLPFKIILILSVETTLKKDAYHFRVNEFQE